MHWFDKLFIVIISCVGSVAFFFCLGIVIVIHKNILILNRALNKKLQPWFVVAGFVVWFFLMFLGESNVLGLPWPFQFISTVAMIMWLFFGLGQLIPDICHKMDRIVEKKERDSDFQSEGTRQS